MMVPEKKIGFIKRVETSGFYGGNSTFINSFGKTKFSCFTLPPTQHHSFFKREISVSPSSFALTKG